DEEEYEIWIWNGEDIDPAARLRSGVGFRRSDEAPPVPLQNPEAAPGGPASIVVLPFDNMSGDPAARSIVDGIVEEITASLSRVRDFAVVARNSAYAYRDRAVDVRDIARDLGVRYVLEGSLRKAGER